MTADEPLEGLTVAGHPSKAAREQRAEIERIVNHATAITFQVDHGRGDPFTLDDATKAVSHALANVPKSDLPAVVAYLACQVVGYRRSADVDSRLALEQIAAIVGRWRQQHRGPGHPKAERTRRALQKAGHHELADWVAGRLLTTAEASDE